MKVLILGAGGLGCPAGLALQGRAELTIADFDVVELSNLHRQILYGREDLGQPKALVAAKKLGATPLELKVTPQNAAQLFRRFDLVIDGTDAGPGKLAFSDAAVHAQVPLIYGGVLKLAGQAMVVAPSGPCLRCLFEELAEGPTCAQAGILGTVAGVVGLKQAELALNPQPGLHVFDGTRLTWRTIEVKRAQDCPVCPASVDITKEVCPMTYVRVKLAMEKLESGRLLEVWLKGDEPLKNVPQSARDEGHEVLSLTAHGDRSRLLLKVS